MEMLQLTPDDVWSLSHKIEEVMFQEMAKLKARTEQVVSDLKKGDAAVNRSNVFNEWAKELCKKISVYVADDKLVWVGKDSEPQDISRASMKQVPNESIKY
jgi:hypothetical protein